MPLVSLEAAEAPVEEAASRGVAFWSARDEACGWLRAALEPLGFQVHRDLGNDDVALIFIERADDELPLQIVKMRAQRGQPMIVLTSDREARIVAVSLGIADVMALPADAMELTLRIERLANLQRDQRRTQLHAEAERRVHHAKEEQATLLIHDLKNPISTILANVEFAREALSDPVLASDALQDAGIGCRRALRLLGNLLDVARNEAGCFALHRQTLPLLPMLAEVAHELETRVRGRDILIELDVPRDLVIDADLELLRRAVENILDNAIRYVPDAGEIAIVARQTAEATELRVGNSGPSIPRGDRERIFEKFERGALGGQANLGLGLHFCRLVAVAHGGRISVEADRLPTEFVFVLPRGA